MVEARLLQVRMVRRSLADVPQFPLPAGFTLRRYRPGDVETWVRIEQAADRHLTGHREIHKREFAAHETLLGARQLFLCEPGGEGIGTATAWFGDHDGEPCGRVHWMAIVPEWQGKGLGKPLLTALCNRLRELGHTRAYLITETVRVPAIKLYLKFGFVPDIRGDADRAAWQDVQRRGLEIDV
ncbi:MAG: GNAT family N-acetyltransferase [Verrucomicrobia bacterium]|nr:GNAT family N-acetyltransferase [Verrucomicrobiota bacterium]